MNEQEMEIEKKLPQPLRTALDLMHKNGVEAYIVGGCVRDILRGHEPADFDVTSSADTAEIARIFAGYKVCETGAKFGTVTVVCDNLPIEITTMRRDGDYSDGRRPDFVELTQDINEDLVRRDFTINAMAWSAQTGIIDPFGGQEDLKNGILRAVGNPDVRFAEDALRMLRAMRFSASIPCEIEEKTASSILRNYSLLECVSAERILSELWRLICGVSAKRVVRKFENVIFFIMPELEPMRNFEQKSLYHIYDVWEHTLHVVSNAPADRITRMAALLHDCGKPQCMKIDSDGRGHFKAHAVRGAEMAEGILVRLHASKADLHDVWELVRHHDDDIPENDYGVRKYLSFFGEKQMRRFLDLQEADSRAKSERSDTQFAIELRARLEIILRNGDVTCLANLAVNGHDLQQIGIEGTRVGVILNKLLEHVWHDPSENTRDNLLKVAKTMV